MIISYQKKFAVFLPWKTASQTLVHRLAQYDESPYNKLYYFNSYLNRVVHQHITCAEFVCLPESKLGFFTASFVRNPYDRVYSGFRQIQKAVQNQPKFSYPEPWIRNLVMKQLAEIDAQLFASQYKFDNWLELISDEQIYEVGRNTSFPIHPSHYWTHIAQKKVVDFIGYVENFEADFQKLLSHIDVQPVKLVNANVVDLEGNTTNNPFGYRYIDRMNASSIQKINRLFEQDFNLFGYKQIM